MRLPEIYAYWLIDKMAKDLASLLENYIEHKKNQSLTLKFNSAMDRLDGLLQYSGRSIHKTNTD